MPAALKKLFVDTTRRVTLGAKGAKMCTQAPAPGYTLCMQAPAANFKTPDWLRTGPNQSGAGAWVHIVYAGAGAWVHIMYAGAGAWVHILAPFALSVTRLGGGVTSQRLYTMSD